MTEMPLDDVLAALDLRRCAPDTFLGTCLPLPGERVFGGQFLAQAVVAANRTVRDGTAPHSLHAYFLRPGDPREPVRFTVDRVGDGHSSRIRSVEAVQHGRTVFHLLASFRNPGSGPCHQDTAPVVPAPETLPPRYPFGASTGPLVLCRAPDDARRPGGDPPRTGGADAGGAAPGDGGAVDDDRGRGDETARSTVWLRALGRLPDDALTHTAVLAYLSDLSILHAALRRHGLRGAGNRARTASLDHALWLHRPVRVDDWLLYDTVSPSAGGARALGTGRLFDRRGHLVATVAQEGMVRLPDG